MGGDFDLSGALRRIRRQGDLSQRDLAHAAGLSSSTIAHAEAGTRDLPVRSLVAAASVAGLRLALLDAEGREVEGMSEEAVRDAVGRHFPAHLDTRYSDQGWWHGPERYSRPQPWYTFDLDRARRNGRRDRAGRVPDDHQLPQAGDSPSERAAARRRAAARERAAEQERRLLAGELAHLDRGFTCTCPPACDELDDWSGRPVHCDDCTCRCDVG